MRRFRLFSVLLSIFILSAGVSFKRPASGGAEASANAQTVVLAARSAPLAAPTDSSAHRMTPVAALGADLSPEQQQSVLKRLGVDQTARIITVTNAEERALLKERFTAQEIGTRAISSVYIVPAAPGAGIQVTTENITRVDAATYEQALLTAGVHDAVVRVAAPFPVSGTAALVGVFKAFEAIQGAALDPERKSAAVLELAVAERLQEANDPEKVAELFSTLKTSLASGLFKSPEDIEATIRREAARLGLVLSEQDIAAVRDLIERLKGLDIDWDRVKKELKAVQDAVGEWLSQPETQSLLQKIGNWLKQLFQMVVDWWNRWLNSEQEVAGGLIVPAA
ncbi:MAG: DUF1002 domain-containing protein [Hydrogenibacillus sp.]|nr:DUF1002 domain-containing protein [Hydrogenibacillus sp.]